MPSSEALACRVCGLRQAEPPWGSDGQAPSHEICDCCGVEFGYEDMRGESVRRYRQAWVERGYPWFNQSARPTGWSFDAQAGSIPSGFR